MIGQSISHYTILEKLGEGGMGVVYKAQDTKLDRFVALKFLPPHLSASEQDKARFIIEAKSASALNHPNVATVYEIDEVEGRMFIAMEYVDGVTLRERIHSLSFKQAIDIGIQLADGLAAAHEKGVVHRDIKPENIMIRKDGIAQIMDFGLAKLRGTKSQVNRLTKEGSTIGTAGYMSPEQVQGQDVDHRSDIFSLGVVLYELLTGELPFKGVHETALMYEIVNVDAVPMSAVKPDFDPTLDGIVLECLAKEPAERYQSVAEVSKELRRFKRESTRQRVSRVTSVRNVQMASPSATNIPVVGSASAVPQKRSTSRVIWIMLSIVMFVIAATTGFLYYRAVSRPLPVIEFLVSPPDRGQFEAFAPAISPDGKYIVYAARDSAGKSSLWMRSVANAIAKPMSGTDEGAFPFWSPDSRSIGFFTRGKLRKIDVDGGSPQTICDAPDGRGGTWNAEGVIVFAPDWQSGLSKVSSAGGLPTVISRLDSLTHEVTHRFPTFLADGKHIAFWVRSADEGKSGQHVCALDGTEEKLLFYSESSALFASGYLLYVREKTLVAQKCDPGNGEPIGEPIPVAERVGMFQNWGTGAFSVSQNGIVATMESASGNRELVWFDRSGKKLEQTVAKGEIYDFSLAPDEKEVVYRRIDPQTRNQDLWLLDMVRNTQTRFTFDSTIDDDPVFSPDGSKVAFDSSPRGHADLYTKASSGAANPEVLLESGTSKFTLDWSRDGRYILYQVDDPATKSDVWIVPLTGDKKPFPFLQTKFSETTARISYDGEWVAYSSDESGKYEVYIQHLPQSGGKWQVSVDGGAAPSWREDGKELYYLAPDKKLMSVDITVLGSALEVGIPKPLFDTSVDTYNAPNRYAPASGGQRFLLNSAAQESGSMSMTVLINWMSKIAPR